MQKSFILFLVTFFLIFHPCFSQVTKFVHKTDQEIHEEFYVLKEKKDVKHGTYVKYRKEFFGVSLIESGSYLNGTKDGLWEYYFHSVDDIFYYLMNIHPQSNSLIARGFYSNGKKEGQWTYYYVDTVSNISNREKFGNWWKTDSMSVEIEHKDLRIKQTGVYQNDLRIGDWLVFDFDGKLNQRYNFSDSLLLYDETITDTSRLNRERGPVYLGGSVCLVDYLIDHFYFDGLESAMKKQDSSRVIIQIAIDHKGNKTSMEIVESNGSPKMEAESIKIMGLIDNNWLPALKNGKPVNSFYKISLTILKKKPPIRMGFCIIFQPIIDN